MLHLCGTTAEPGAPLPNQCRTNAELAQVEGHASRLRIPGRGRLWHVMEINGRPAESDDLSALAFYNYGHYTSMRIEDMYVRGLMLHMERLARDAQKVFGIDLDIDRVRELLRSFASKMDAPAIVRVTVFDSATDMNKPGKPVQPDILISARYAPANPLPPLRVESAQFQRDMPDVKNVGLFGALSKRRSAQLRGFDDALFVDYHSRVLEGPTWNIGFFDGNHVIWPKADSLPGVTLNLVKSVAAGSGLTSVESIVHVSQISETWTAFATNASIGVRPIQSIDSVELVDESPIIRDLQLLYSAIPGERV